VPDLSTLPPRPAPDLVNRIELRLDATAPAGDVLEPLARLLRQLRDRRRAAAGPAAKDEMVEIKQPRPG
jgi:hypothetical protein